MWAWIWTLTWTQGTQVVSSASRPTDPCHPHLTRRHLSIHRAWRGGYPPCPRYTAWAAPPASRSPGWRAAEDLPKIDWPVRLEHIYSTATSLAYFRKKYILKTNINKNGVFICFWLLRSMLSANNEDIALLARNVYSLKI